MSKRANFFKIGIFVLTATTVLILGLIIFGLREVFRPGVMVESCFDQSVQGLTIGSDVKFRGVKIGTVQQITLVSAEYPDVPPEYRKWVLVRSKIDQQFFHLNQVGNPKEMLSEEISKGMRAYLSPQGITGLVFVEFDYQAEKADEVEEDPEKPANKSELHATPWETHSHVLYIPAGAGFIKSVMESVQSVSASMQKFMQNDFPSISTKTITAIEGATATMQDVRDYMAKPEFDSIPAKIEAIAENIRILTGEEQQKAVRAMLADAQEITSATLAVIRSQEIRRSIANTNQVLEETRTLLATVQREIPETAVSLRDTLDRVDYLIASQQQGLGDVTAELRAVLRNLEVLTATLRDNPSLILFSTDPLPTEPSQ